MDEMKQLLVSWKLEALYDTFEEYGFNIDSFPCVDESSLENMFPEKRFYGPLKLFKMHHSDWLKTLTHLQKSRSPLKTSESSRQDQAGSCNSEQFNLGVFLADNDALLSLKRQYDKEKKFVHDDRIEVANEISDELIKIDYKMSVTRFIEISKQIATIFELEDVEKYYRKHNGKSMGILYTQYYNRLAAATKKKKKKNLKRGREPSSEPESDVSTALNDEIKAAMEWMEKHNPVNEGDDEAEQCLGENWRYCFKYRMESIQLKNGDVDEVMKMWPVLQNSYGASFIEDDFRSRFGSKTESLKSNWSKFLRENITVLRNMLVCPSVRRELTDLIKGEVEDTRIHDIRMIFALLHLMEPQTTTLKDKSKFRPTIPSAKERLLNKVLDQSQIKGIVSLVMKDRQNKQLNVYPMIMGIGEDIENIQEFLLQYKEICYPCDNFIDALDSAFKFHIFFNVRFSPEHKRFWALLNGLFYKLETPLLDISTSISSHISSFKI